MENHLLIGVSSLLVIGIGAQWLADRVKLPSILLLLVGGFVAGPVAGLLRPTELFGEVLPTLVSLAVGIILFDGGLSLRFSEIREVRAPVRRLITVGALVTWVVGTLAAKLLLPFEWRLSLLIAAIVIVSGPTVVLPLLRQIHPKGRIGSVLKWEGIFIDPIGAVTAVLVFEVIVAGEERGRFGLAVLLGLLRTAGIGAVVGFVAAALLVILLRRYLIPHHLEIGVTLALVVAAFTGSNLLQPESGLLTVTVMGVLLANQRIAPVRHIVEFGETLGVLLTSVLFIVLAADLQLESFTALGWPIILFTLVLILVARPLATLVSTIGTDLERNERILAAWMAPRGIVAASVASVFAVQLQAADVAGADLLVPYVFTVIVGAATVYGLTAGPLARRLGLADPNPQGIVMIGAHSWARDIAELLEDEGFHVTLVPTNRADLSAARLAGLSTYGGSVLQEDALDRMDLDRVGRIIALTHNEEFNSLAALRFMEVVGRSNVFQLPADREAGAEGEVTHDLRGRLLFGSDVTFHALDERFRAGATIKRTTLTDEFGWDDFCAQYAGEITPLFVIEDDVLTVISSDGIDAGPGQTVVSVVPGTSADHATARRRNRDARTPDEPNGQNGDGESSEVRDASHRLTGHEEDRETVAATDHERPDEPDPDEPGAAAAPLRERIEDAARELLRPS